MSMKWKLEVPRVPLFNVEKAGQVLNKEALTAMDMALIKTQQNIVLKTAPHGATGLLKASIKTERRWSGSILLGRVYSAVKYAIVVEKGRKASWAPYQPLVNWVRLSVKGKKYFAGLKSKYPDITPVGAAVVLARSEKRRARKGQFFFKRGIEMSRDYINNTFSSLLRRLATELT